MNKDISKVEKEMKYEMPSVCTVYFPLWKKPSVIKSGMQRECILGAKRQTEAYFGSFMYSILHNYVKLCLHIAISGLIN